MAKIKLNLLLIFIKCFLLSFVIFEAGGSGPNEGKADGLKLSLSLVLQRLEALEQKHQKLEKSHAELKEPFNSLKKQVEELKNENCVGEDVWLLTPPLRGRRGQKGERGENEIVLVKPGQEESSEIPDRPSNPVTSCSVAMEILPSPRSKKQTIYPYGNRTSLEVLCDFEVDGGGWTVIQKRSSGPWNDFFRSWYAYEKGFGSLDKNFWIGLENIHALTNNGDQELRIELEDFEGEKRWAKYSSFSISDASDFYRLSLDGFSGDVGNNLMSPPYPSHAHNGMQFSTADQDNDKYWDNCAEKYASGWWFNACTAANLNGPYYEKWETVPRGQGINWLSWKGNEYSLRKTEMKIRRRK